jgi:hypothetical protein
LIIFPNPIDDNWMVISSLATLISNGTLDQGKCSKELPMPY